MYTIVCTVYSVHCSLYRDQGSYLSVTPAISLETGAVIEGMVDMHARL